MESLLLTGRAGDIGHFQVQRILPSRKKRMVGPFIFLDQMGPTELNAGQGLDVLPHPHIGLSTLTYLFEGSILHRDSLGNEQQIEPGAVNWMTAGRGIVHSERSSQESRSAMRTLHGLQIWVALPVEQEETEPSFDHYPAASIPEINLPSGRLRLVAGKYADHVSPVRVSSKLVMLDFQLKADATISLSYPGFELGLYAVSGRFESEQTIESGQMLITETDARIKALNPGRLIVLGGVPLPEVRHIDWNFVSSRKERIAEAIDLWQKQQFPRVRGETEFVPYP
ncbi:MAG: pirin family protein [Spirochaetales bacterium]|nr:pirin family protein [Spirochaetales bacterium]